MSIDDYPSYNNLNPKLETLYDIAGWGWIFSDLCRRRGRGGRGGEGSVRVTGEGRERERERERETTQAWSLGYSEIIILSGIERVPPTTRSYSDKILISIC